MDIRDEIVEWSIDLAKRGDWSGIAGFLRSDMQIPPLLRLFLADVFEGKEKMRGPIKATYQARSDRWLSEMMVARFVDSGMCHRGRQRDRNLRTQLTRKWCEVYGTTPDRVEKWLRFPSARRFPHRQGLRQKKSKG
jgi:hypothetical protein